MSKRQDVPNERRDLILAAAKEAFSRYGFARTSMADVATLAGISRPALYEHFKNRTDLFRSLSETMCESSLQLAREAWVNDASFEEGLVAAVLAKELELFRLLRLSPHGAEILERGAVLTRDLHERMELEFAALVTKRSGRRGAAAQALGLTIARAMEGLKQGAQTETEFVASVRQLAAVLGAGLAG